jgi:hypothetical protein
MEEKREAARPRNRGDHRQHRRDGRWCAALLGSSSAQAATGDDARASSREREARASGENERRREMDREPDRKKRKENKAHESSH